VARTHTHLNLGENMKPMSELPDYKVEPGDPDPRGWTVTTNDGRTVGRVEDLVIDTSAMKVRYLIVAPSGTPASSATSNAVLLNTNEVDLHKTSREVVARSFGGAQQTTTDREAQTTAGVSNRSAAESRSADRDRNTLTRSEEELNINKREVSRGEARVGKHVETEHVREPVTRKHEELIVERRPVETGARADASISNDEIRVPLKEEEVVVEKRPVVKEELVVGKREVEEREVVEADVRRERFDVENDTRPGAPPRQPHRDER
jgi:uncharacterized protein (TIGR02271 family)